MTRSRTHESIAALALVAGCASAVTPRADDAGASADRAVAACPEGTALIPAGMFVMGDPMADDPVAQPLHGVRLSAFCLDLTEVTVAAYGACAAPGCTPVVTGGACNAGVAGRDDHPINCVDWNQADAYCRSVGGALPTEAQWEYAARGSDGRTYPWGSAAPAAQLCWSGGGTSRSSTCPVGAFAAGASPQGVFDLAGNVYEWTADWYDVYRGSVDAYVLDPTGAGPAGNHRSNRGGAWRDTVATDARSSVRSESIPTYREVDLGFRCARAPM